MSEEVCTSLKFSLFLCAAPNGASNRPARTGLPTTTGQPSFLIDETDGGQSQQ